MLHLFVKGGCYMGGGEIRRLHKLMLISTFSVNFILIAGYAEIH